MLRGQRPRCGFSVMDNHLHVPAFRGGCAVNSRTSRYVIDERLAHRCPAPSPVAFRFGDQNL